MLSMRFVALRLVIINSGKWRENRVWPKNKIYTQIVINEINNDQRINKNINLKISRKYRTKRKNRVKYSRFHFKFHFKFQIIRFDCPLEKEGRRKKGKLCRSFLTFAKFNIFVRKRFDKT